eukprot:5487745-Prymnesium_polylepis.1
MAARARWSSAEALSSTTGYGSSAPRVTSSEPRSKPNSTSINSSRGPDKVKSRQEKRLKR